ncbi:MAG: LacI family DNA-binding transcriptional regulator [Opitutales bacterium]|nr:LacI family DNA-binding transcriptional regulator [Opitutales bacterium]
MKDVAVRAGVSQATVSHALRGTGRVSAATRERIRRLALEMGFREDPMMSALAAYRSRRGGARSAPQNIALLVAEEPVYSLEKAEDVRGLRAGVAAAAEQWGMHVELFPHDGRPDTAKRLTRVLHHRGIRGVILYFPRPSEKVRPRELDWEKFVVIACKPIFSRHIFHSVSTDHFANGRKLYRKIHGMGYRRIGLCFSEALDLVSNRAFKAGVWTEEQSLGTDVERVAHLIMPQWDQDQFNEWFRKWGPEIIITQNWRIYSWMKALGMRIPEDIGVAVPATTAREFYSGIDPNHNLMGREAVRLLREQLILGNYGIPPYPLNVNIPCEWHDGQTLRNPGA